MLKVCFIRVTLVTYCKTKCHCGFYNKTDQRTAFVNIAQMTASSVLPVHIKCRTSRLNVNVAYTVIVQFTASCGCRLSASLFVYKIECQCSLYNAYQYMYMYL